MNARMFVFKEIPYFPNRYISIKTKGFYFGTSAVVEVQ